MTNVTKSKLDEKEIENKVLQGLLNWIRWINLVPPDLVLPNADEMLMKLAREQAPDEQIMKLDLADFDISEDEFYKHSQDPYPFDNLYQIIFERIANELKETALELIMNIIINIKTVREGEEGFSPSRFYTEYEAIRLAREFLIPIATETTFYAKHRFRNPFLAEISQNKNITDGFVFSNNRIKFRANPLKELLEKIEADRLRICEICKQVFWANRLDKWTCSTKCGQVARVRKLRQKEKKDVTL